MLTPQMYEAPPKKSHRLRKWLIGLGLAVTVLIGGAVGCARRFRGQRAQYRRHPRLGQQQWRRAHRVAVKHGWLCGAVQADRTAVGWLRPD